MAALMGAVPQVEEAELTAVDNRRNTFHLTTMVNAE
jgi:hypothetical protein